MRKMNTFLFFVVIPLMLCAKDEQKWKEVTIGNAIVVSVPSDVEISEKAPVHDFVISQFMRSGERLIIAYLGDYPRFPSREALMVKDWADVGKWKAKFARLKIGSSLSEEILIDFGADQPWPRFVHYGFIINGETDKVLVERIIQTTRLVEKVNPTGQPKHGENPRAN